MFRLKNIIFKDILEIDELIIQEDKVTCIIGESGSGKTTLLRLLNNLISPDNGEIFYKDHDLQTMDSVELRRKVVMLPQTPVIYPGSIKDNLLIGLEFSEKSFVEDDKLQEILNIVSLNKDLNEKSENLSGGEKQRLALGRVILLDPEVFLLDEPSASLDDETEQLIIEEIVKYTKDNNKTLIMVTHSKKIAEEYSDDILEIHQGKILKKEL